MLNKPEWDDLDETEHEIFMDSHQDVLHIIQNNASIAYEKFCRGFTNSFEQSVLQFSEDARTNK